MKLAKKIALSVVVHIVWLMLIIAPGFILITKSSRICDVLVSPLMIGIVYPIVSIILLVTIYKINRLESKKEQRIYIIASGLMSAIILVWTIPYFLICIANNYSFTGL